MNSQNLDSVEPELQSLMLNYASVGVVLLNENRKVQYVNTKTEELTGFTGEDLLRGGDFFEMVVSSPRYLEQCHKQITRGFEKNMPDFDLSINKKSGEKVNLIVSGSYMESGERPFLLLILHNITNRKAFEEVIESSFDKFIHTTKDLDLALKKIREQRQILEEYKQKLQSELEMAIGVQQAFIPQSFPRGDAFDMYGLTLPSSELGGDYFDIFELGQDRLGILVADVSGHGVPSALITSMAKVFFVNYSRQYEDPADTLSRVNDDLGKILRGTGFFLSAVYSILDLSSMKITTATGGADNPLCYNSGTDKIYPLGNSEGGVIMGCFSPDEVSFQSRTNTLEKGCTVLIYTDGIIEARNPKDDLYGKGRLLKYIRENHYLPAKEFVHKLIEEVDNFYEGEPPNDDRTLLALNVLKVPHQERKADQVINKIKEHFNVGQLKYGKKQYEEAIKEFEAIIDLDSESFRAHEYLGLCYTALKQHQQAYEYYTKVVANNPEYPEGYYNLGKTCFTLQKYTEAKLAWKALQELSDNYKETESYLEMLEKLLENE